MLGHAAESPLQTISGPSSLDPHSVEPTKGRWFLAFYAERF
jgi:hypothetical protein